IGSLRPSSSPYFTTSHLIHLVDTARLFASPSFTVTIITTLSNAALFQASVNRDIAAGNKITVQTLRCPSAEGGLPEEIENFGTADSIEIAIKVSQGVFLLQKPMEKWIRNGRPHCIVSVMLYPWTVDIAGEMKIPRLMFYANNCFYHCVYNNLKLHAPHDKVECGKKRFVIPGLPDEIEMTRAQLEDYHSVDDELTRLFTLAKESGLRSYGTVFNSFYKLEPA
ncbi:unnamed protein product, partial [Thlaspi arvense]